MHLIFEGNTFTNSSQNFNSISPLNMTPQSPTFSSLDSNVTSQSSLSPSNQSISSSTNSLSPINSNNSTIQIGGRKKPYYNFDKLNTLDEYTLDDFELSDYKHHPSITMQMRV